jgi:hypothetical protein
MCDMAGSGVQNHCSSSRSFSNVSVYSLDEAMFFFAISSRSEIAIRIFLLISSSPPSHPFSLKAADRLRVDRTTGNDLTGNIRQNE